MGRLVYTNFVIRLPTDKILSDMMGHACVVGVSFATGSLAVSAFTGVTPTAVKFVTSSIMVLVAVFYLSA